MKQAFHFKGGNFTVSVININTTSIKNISDLLEAKTSQSKTFFKNTPFAIDIRDIELNSSITMTFLQSLFDTFKNKEMLPIGFILNTESLKEQLIKNNHNILKLNKLKDNQLTDNSKYYTSKIITTPIRTGQSIFCKDQDLIITSNINNGAEVRADGNIIVYGRIGGTVIAGCSGNKSAKIICKDLKAELICIAGIYTSLNNKNIFKDKSFKDGYIISLKNDKIHIEKF